MHERSAQRDAWDGPLAIVVWKKVKVAVHQIIVQTLTGIVCVPLKCILAENTFSPLVGYFSGGIYDNEIATWLSLSTARLGATSGE